MTDNPVCRIEISKGNICGNPAVAEVRIRDKVGKAAVPVCAEHKAAYNRKAAEIRAS